MGTCRLKKERWEGIILSLRNNHDAANKTKKLFRIFGKQETG